MVSLFSGNAAHEVEASLAGAGVSGRIAVLGDVRLARRLAGGGRDVLCIGRDPRALKRARGPAMVGAPCAVPLADRSLGALVAAGLAEIAWEPFLSEWCRVVAPGGLVVVVDRHAAAELGRRALCAGLTAIEQRATGRTVVTAGRWHPF